MEFDFELDYQVRQKAFSFLEEMNAVHGDFLSRDLIANGFEFRGRRIHLVGSQGIFKPQILQLPISITTSPGTHVAHWPVQKSGGKSTDEHRSTQIAHKGRNISQKESVFI